jgi:beta propeller repeat protein
MARIAHASAMIIGAALFAPGDARGNASGQITQLSTGSKTDHQEMPAISGNNVVWTDVSNATTPSIQNIVYDDLATGSVVPLTNSSTSSEQNFLEDIDGDNVVWTQTSANFPGNIVVYNVATHQGPNVVATSTSAVLFQQPSIRGHYITFVRVTGAQAVVDVYDSTLGFSVGPVTPDPAASQARPRVGGDFAVYEDYTTATGNGDVLGWRISTAGPPFVIASGPNAQTSPDIDGNTVIYVETVGGSDQLFAYDLVTGIPRQLTTASSHKVFPRVSGSLVVWSDDRAGNWDLYLYDLTAGTEQLLVGGPGDQFLSDIDGNRVVYTDNSSSFEQIMLFTIGTPQPDPPPDPLPPGCDPDKTDPVGSPVHMRRTGARPAYASGSFTAEANKTYWVCVENGLPDGSERTAQLLFATDRGVVLTPSDFRPVANPPHWVAAQIIARSRKAMAVGPHDWDAALFGTRMPDTVNVSIRVSK